MPGVFIPKASGAYFHSPSLSPEEFESWLAENAEFSDTYADWVSGAGNPLIGKIPRPPEQAYAQMVLRAYLPGFVEAEEAVDPYRENTSATPKHPGASSYSLSDKMRAVMMAERLGVNKTAKKLGIPRSTLQGWIKSYSENTSATPSKPAGRPRGQRPDKACMGCGTLTRTHVAHKPLCRSCYIKTEEYQSDRRQWQSDMMMLRKVVGE
jgi:transposase-like protein